VIKFVILDFTGSQYPSHSFRCGELARRIRQEVTTKTSQRNRHLSSTSWTLFSMFW